MRIVIDLQGAQTGNQFRGIGRYSMSLAHAIVQNKGSNEILLLLNGLYTDSVFTIRQSFKDSLPEENIKIWFPVSATKERDQGVTWARKASEIIYEAYVANLQPDVVLISSLFEGLNDDLVTSIGGFSMQIPTAVILYDLIPCIYSSYLEEPVVKNWYSRRLDHLRRANRWLSISEATRQEAIQYLNLPADHVINISTAADPQFQRKDISLEEEQELREKYRLKPPFVLYTGAMDYRKNMEGLIRAFALLPEDLRATHQLAIVCVAEQQEREYLEAIAYKHGLNPENFIFTGFVTDNELVSLYNLCKLFVFPSWHEGFGLPALEAMHCGAAVIASNKSSLPEVVGLEEALFDPLDLRSITAKIEEALSDEPFRQRLLDHAPGQAEKFSWDQSARAAMAALEDFHAARQSAPFPPPASHRKLKMAFVSPLPPERSGVSDYSAELLPELARYYDIHVVIDQHDLTDPWILKNCEIHRVQWFMENAAAFDRVLYHFGNSHYHKHMFQMLEHVPGVVIFHDFCLGHNHNFCEGHYGIPYLWVTELYRSHGYIAVYERFHTADAHEVILKYPSNFSIIKRATGVIVHSTYPARLAASWYGAECSRDWAVVPMLRIPAKPKPRQAAREKLAFPENAYVVASFGFLGFGKLNHRLLDAWIKSRLAGDKDCYLVFVGENDVSDYGKNIEDKIRSAGLEEQILITGWNSMESYQDYLAACDVAVQLRTLSRGETSAAVLDCMNYNIAAVVNAHGSLSDLPEDAVIKLPDRFEDAQLAQVLESLRSNQKARQELAENAGRFVHEKHAPSVCAGLYRDHIERFYHRAGFGSEAVIKASSILEPMPRDDSEVVEAAACISENIPAPRPSPQLLIDISMLVQHDAKTGIQRVVRSILRELLLNPPAGYRVEPVYANQQRTGYFYARKFTLKFLECKGNFLEDSRIEASAGDYFLGLDLSPQIVPHQLQFLQHLRQHGVKLNFVIYDLLPVSFPFFFPAEINQTFEEWCRAIAQFDKVLCISQSVAREYSKWMNDFGVPLSSRPKVETFYLGADFKSSSLFRGFPAGAEHVIQQISAFPTFLMVGTMEPRKGYAQTLAAFEALWARGGECCLVIVGKKGWSMDFFLEKMRNHPLFDQRLFWLDEASDEYLEKIYTLVTCLIAASEGEGFGLPLIEASMHGIPLIARDLPIFREIAGDHAYYFSGFEGADLAEAISRWMELKAAGQHPSSAGISWLTWSQSAQQLRDVLIEPSKPNPSAEPDLRDSFSMHEIKNYLSSLEALEVERALS